MGYENENQGLEEVPVFVFHCTFRTKFFEWVHEMPFFLYIYNYGIVLAFYIRGRLLFKFCLEGQDF
jgi:hypothetical protein